MQLLNEALTYVNYDSDLQPYTLKQRNPNLLGYPMEDYKQRAKMVLLTEDCFLETYLRKLKPSLQLEIAEYLLTEQQSPRRRFNYNAHLVTLENAITKPWTPPPNNGGTYYSRIPMHRKR
jgi:hypothetical protein